MTYLLALCLILGVWTMTFAEDVPTVKESTQWTVKESIQWRDSLQIKIPQPAAIMFYFSLPVGVPVLEIRATGEVYYHGRLLGTDPEVWEAIRLTFTRDNWRQRWGQP